MVHLLVILALFAYILLKSNKVVNHTKTLDRGFLHLVFLTISMAQVLN